MLNRYWRFLWIPLLAAVLTGTAAQTREVFEEEPPIVASACGFTAVQARLRRIAPEPHSLPKPTLPTSNRSFFPMDRPAVAIAPHGRPDNTRGDPGVA